MQSSIYLEQTTPIWNKPRLFETGYAHLEEATSILDKNNQSDNHEFTK